MSRRESAETTEVRTTALAATLSRRRWRARRNWSGVRGLQPVPDDVLLVCHLATRPCTRTAQLSSDDMTTSPPWTRRLRWMMKPRDRRQKIVDFLIMLPLCALTYLVVNDLVLEAYPVPPWFTPLAIPFIAATLIAHTA